MAGAAVARITPTATRTAMTPTPRRMTHVLGSDDPLGAGGLSPSVIGGRNGPTLGVLARSTSWTSGYAFQSSVGSSSVWLVAGGASRSASTAATRIARIT
jgi:hypothetical protein